MWCLRVQFVGEIKLNRKNHLNNIDFLLCFNQILFVQCHFTMCKGEDFRSYSAL